MKDTSYDINYVMKIYDKKVDIKIIQGLCHISKRVQIFPLKKVIQEAFRRFILSNSGKKHGCFLITYNNLVIISYFEAIIRTNWIFSIT